MKRQLFTALICTAAILIPAIPVFASDTKITSIRLEVKDRMQIDSAMDDEDELEIESTSDHYSVSQWDVVNEGISWDPEDSPEVEVTVVADDDCYFSVSKSNIKVRGSYAEVTSVDKESSQELIITLKLTPMSKRVGRIAYADWEGKNAVWAPAEGALSYEVYLFRDSRVVGGKRTSTETTMNFGVAMNKEGEYYYRVRPVGGEGVMEGVFTESESMHQNASALGTTNSVSSGVAGTWVSEGEHWRFYCADGLQQYNDWLLINGKWYFFDADGRMKTGWLLWKDAWYYLGPDGDMWTNCRTPDGYFVNRDGVWVP